MLPDHVVCVKCGAEGSLWLRYRIGGISVAIRICRTCLPAPNITTGSDTTSIITDEELVVDSVLDS